MYLKVLTCDLTPTHSPSMTPPEFVDLSRVYVRFTWWDIEGLGVLFDSFEYSLRRFTLINYMSNVDRLFKALVLVILLNFHHKALI